jgi:pimeloyl-ACP methyl ester carboxylesterase
VLVGESIGGVLALTVSPELPGRVARVYSLNPYDYGESFGRGMRRSRFGFIVALFAVFSNYLKTLNRHQRRYQIRAHANCNNAR